MACAKAVLEHLDVEEGEIQKALESFEGVEGRLQFVRELRGTKIYNDNNATSPDAVTAGLKAVSEGRNVVLVLGGTDKGADMSLVLKEIAETCRSVVLYPGTGTDTIRNDVKNFKSVHVLEGEDLKKCIDLAWGECEEGDVLLFSPAFSSFGKEYQNEYDRNDKFMDLVKDLR